MTDPHDDAQRPDPVLVRPYVKPVPAKPARDPADAPTIIQPAITDDPPDELPPAPPPRRRGRARPLALRLVALIGGLALALAVASWLIFHPATEAAQPGAALPHFTATLPAQQPAASAHASASRSASPSASVSSASPSASASTNPASSLTPSAAPAPTATLAPPPSSARTGAVTAASGRCLMLGGLLGLSGSPVEVSACADIAYQHFTLATDGTLRVNAHCAQIAADNTVHIADCGSATSEQWRAGPSSSLVNPASGACLTDPGQSGATTRAAACTGATDQHWALP